VPVHLHWRHILLVFAGGAMGTAARYLLSFVPVAAGIPVGTFGINVVGALLLGWLLEALALRGTDTGGRLRMRLFAGTGILGGFTTYSALAVDADGLMVADRLGSGLLYAVATILVGALASVAGIALGARLGRMRAARRRPHAPLQPRPGAHPQPPEPAQ
jgi:CrcB protein